LAREVTPVDASSDWTVGRGTYGPTVDQPGAVGQHYVKGRTREKKSTLRRRERKKGKQGGWLGGKTWQNVPFYNSISLQETGETKGPGLEMKN